MVAHVLKSFVFCTALAFATCLAASSAVAQTNAQKSAVQVSAQASSQPLRVTLSWPAHTGATGYLIARKKFSDTAFGATIATLGGSATSHEDTTVELGVAYEYKVTRSGNGNGTGYVAAGVEVAPLEARGRMILLVDATLASGLASEITTLIADLEADGWRVARHNVERSATVPSVRTLIQTTVAAAPSLNHAVYLLGHIPVPYSGNIAPDGHNEHQGAWPADAYYGDLDGVWTDTSVNKNAGRASNTNVPGDGKFDQSTLPSEVELSVGRVDFFNLPTLTQSELELTRAYLNKAHAFKIRQSNPTRRALFFDNFQYLEYPLSSSGLRTQAALVGHGQITQAHPHGSSMLTLLNNESYLWAYGAAGGTQDNEGSYNGAGNIGTTAELATTAPGSVFNMTFGSYFGDWDNKNNFLRAFIGRGAALTNAWSGIPNYYFHHMGVGQPIGYSVRASMNNTTLYTPMHSGWASTGRTHMALMGDPSLRLHAVVPPSSLVVTPIAGGGTNFKFNASSQTVRGYYIYRVSSDGVMSRVLPNHVTATDIASDLAYVQGDRFAVRAVVLENTSSGSYLNLSLASFATATAAALPTDPGGEDVGNGDDAGNTAPDTGNPGDDAGNPGDDTGHTPGNDTGHTPGDDTGHTPGVDAGHTPGDVGNSDDASVDFADAHSEHDAQDKPKPGHKLDPSAMGGGSISCFGCATSGTGSIPLPAVMLGLLFGLIVLRSSRKTRMS